MTPQRKKRSDTTNSATEPLNISRRSIGQEITHHRRNVSAVDATSECESRNYHHVTEYAIKAAKKMGDTKSCCFNPRKEIAIPRFTRDEVVLGNRLGKGGFSNVYEVVRFDLKTVALGDDEAVGCPVGGAAYEGSGRMSGLNFPSIRSLGASSDSKRSLVHPSEKLKLSPSNTNGSHENDPSEKLKLSPSKENGSHENGDGAEANGTQHAQDSDSSDSDSDINLEGLEKVIRRTSVQIGDNDSISSSSSDTGVDELVHPTLHRGKSVSGFADYHIQARRFLQKHCIRDAKSRNHPSTPRYAIKRLRPEVMADDDAYMMGAADLVVEARFLSALEHPNIVKLRGMTHGDVEAFASGVEGDYFLIMDRLSETLECRIQTWKKEVKLIKGKVTGAFMDKDGEKLRSHLAVRLEVAYEIANALKYLHQKGIIFRDLKPENCGFDCRGDVKLFDFGLAKEIRDDEMIQDEVTHEKTTNFRSNNKLHLCRNVYEMSAPCGSYRYMAPEVIRAEPYNLTADTYSFAVMLCEVCSLKKPYTGLTMEQLIQKVSIEDFRPEVPSSGRSALPRPLQNFISLAWSPNLKVRPNMETTCGTLYKMMEQSKKRMNSIEYNRRRSTFVMPQRSFRGLNLGLSKRKLSIDSSS